MFEDGLVAATADEARHCECKRHLTSQAALPQLVIEFHRCKLGSLCGARRTFPSRGPYAK